MNANAPTDAQTKKFITWLLIIVAVQIAVPLLADFWTLMVVDIIGISAWLIWARFIEAPKRKREGRL